MKIRLKLNRGKDLGVSAYILSSGFNFANALLDVVLYESERDELFGQTDNGHETTPSPLTSLPPSPLPSRSVSPLLQDPNPTAAPPKSQSRKRHSKNQSKRNKKKRRLEEPKNAASILPRSAATTRHVTAAVPIPSQFTTLTDAKVASTGYVGLRTVEPDTDGQEFSLSDLVGSQSKFDFNLIEWNAKQTMPIIDNDGRLTTILVAPPQTVEWKTCTHAATEALKKERSRCGFTAEQKDHRRGKFPALSSGILYGNGMTEPANISHNVKNTAALKRLTTHWAFERMSGFVTGVMKVWAPRLYNYYETHLDAVLDSDSRLHRPFENSVFAAAAFNFGPKTVCFPHVDFGNLPFGWCPIWSLGKYNYKKGGHLVLWDLKLVVEFPPGSLIIIPSGVLRHSNTSIAYRETRYSFTQYTPGGLFRWVDFGFQTFENYVKYRDPAAAKRDDEEKRRRWQTGLSLFSTSSELGWDIS
ncbi:hypothetical protein F5880DRAFT_1608305 [Lentinula raphanica]|nr:hypothetical protein F5880DRAFT_1608305 [Lentinula raphanica]